MQTMASMNYFLISELDCCQIKTKQQKTHKYVPFTHPCFIVPTAHSRDILLVTSLILYHFACDNTRHMQEKTKSQQNKTKRWKLAYCRVSPLLCQTTSKFSPELCHFNSQRQKRYDYVTKRTRKSTDNQFMLSNRE